MLRREFWQVNLVFLFLLAVSGCRKSSTLPTSVAPLFFPQTTSTAPASTAHRTLPTTTLSPSAQAQATYTLSVSTPTSTTPPTAAPTPTPTPTPLPTWPDRWQQTGGPSGGAVSVVAVAPSARQSVYAAGLGGAVYQSRDGEIWKPGERMAPPHCAFSSLIIDADDENILFAANHCAGILKSIDGGSSWTRAGAGLDSVALLTQSPHSPGLLLAASNAGQVFRSVDGALNWESVSDGLSGGNIGGLNSSGPDAFWATTNGRDGSLYRFRGGTWSPIELGRPNHSELTNVYVDRNDPATLFVGLAYIENTAPLSETIGLLRSTDGGTTWVDLMPWAKTAVADSSVGSSSVRVHVLGQDHSSDTLYISNGNRLLSSLDNGDTWHNLPLSHDAQADGDLLQMAIGDETLYLPLSNGIVKSVDGGNSWITVNDGLNSLSIGIVATDPADPATLYASSAEGLMTYRSQDYGGTWTRLGTTGLDRATTQRAVDLVLDPNQAGTIYQITDSAQSFRSDDGGATWALAWPDFRFSSINSLATAPSNPNQLYAAKSGVGLFSSNDDGRTWRLVQNAGATDVQVLDIHPDDSAFLMSGNNRTPSGTTAELRRSRDGGATWDLALEVPESSGMTSAVFDPRVQPYFRRGAQPIDPTRLYAASVGARGTVWFSNDAGESWKPLNEDLNFANVETLTLVPRQAGVIYASLSGNGTWRSEDSGQNWRRLPGDPATAAAGVSVDPSNHNIIYIADGTTPHLYRSTDDGRNWELLFDAGTAFHQLTALTIAPSDPRILYVSALGTTSDTLKGAIFRINTGASAEEFTSDVTSNLPGAASSLAVDRYDPFRVLATVDGAGLWKTDNGGTSWRQLTNGLPEASFNQIAIDPSQPNTLYLVGGHDVHRDTYEKAGLAPDEIHGVWKSTDDGSSWQKLGGRTFGRASGQIRSIAFHPSDERVKYVVGEMGVYLSPDNGETWTSINGRLSFASMSTVSTDGQNLYVGSKGGGVFVGPIHPLIYTADWARESSLPAPVDHIQIVLDPQDPQILYISAYPGGIFKTQDGGNTWSAHGFGLPNFSVADRFRHGRYALAIAPSAPHILYVGLYGHGVYRSDDGAGTWRPVPGELGELERANVQALLIHPTDPDIVYVATAHGVWRTINGGHSWASFSEGLPPNGDIRDLVLSSNDQLYAGTGGYGIYARPAFHQAGDDAWQQLPELGNWSYLTTTWDNRSTFQSSLLVPTDDNPEMLFAGSFPSGIFGTDDGGATWRERNVGLYGLGVLAFVRHPHDSKILYAGTTSGVSRSADGGTSWHSWDQGWPSGQHVVSITVDPAEPDTLYACSSSGQFPEQSPNPAPIAADDVGGTVMKSSDGGATWLEITTGLDTDQGFQSILIDRFDPRILYLATEQSGVFISRDSGATWSSWSEGLWDRYFGRNGMYNFDILQFSVDGRLLFLGSSGSGVWRRPAAGLP